MIPPKFLPAALALALLPMPGLHAETNPDAPDTAEAPAKADANDRVIPDPAPSMPGSGTPPKANPNAANTPSAKEIAAATQATTAWLEDIDAEDYAKAWEAAGPLMQNSITEEEWTQQMKLAAQNVGRVKYRKLDMSSLRNSVPLPDGTKVQGTYVVLRYNSAFSIASEAKEIVTFQKVKDGEWKAAGYYVEATGSDQSPAVDVKAQTDVNVRQGDAENGAESADAPATEAKPDSPAGT
ncbi:MAG: DUF4019 domain-containing protein [Verrucomicrobiota bacterium]